MTTRAKFVQVRRYYFHDMIIARTLNGCRDCARLELRTFWDHATREAERYIARHFGV
jgi:hypothetical protein